MKKIGTIAVMGVALMGCGGTEDGRGVNVDANGFPPVSEGYTRFAMPEIKDIAPGVDGMWCQYVSEPFAEDSDVLDFGGWQSVGGHHIVLYATSINAPVGTTRTCNDSDMVSVRYLGAIGGEGTSNVGQLLPQGTAFRVPKGFSLMANTHFINVGSEPLDGAGYIDMKLGPADVSAKTATLFVNIDQNISVAPHQTGNLDANCVVGKDLEVYVAANHLHEHGKSVFTEVLRKDGTSELLVKNDFWTKEMTFNTPMKFWEATNPFRIFAGDTVHTHCEWNNTTSEELAFPTEMCVGISFIVGEAQINCVDGVWDAQ